MRWLRARALAATLVSTAIVCLVPATADASLSVNRGRQAIKRKALNFRYGYEAGSGVFLCGKHGPNRVTCDVLFNDADGDTWCGNGAARRRAGHVHAWIRVGMDGCQYFKPVAIPRVAAAHAATRACSNTYGGDVIQTRNVRCRKAHRIVRTWARRYKRDEKVNRRVLRFRCRGRNDRAEGLVVRCKRGRASLTFYANVP